MYEDLHNGTQEDVHIYRLTFYKEKDLNSKAVMRHFLTSQTEMTASILLELEEMLEGLSVRVSWDGFFLKEDTLALKRFLKTFS